MGGLAETFDQSRLTTSASRIADVAEKHTYTIIGDSNHADAAPHEIIANPETMHALSSAGVKHIAMEMFLVADQPVLDAYADGALSDRTMKYVVDKMSPPSLTQDGLGLDDTFQRNAYYDIVHNAKAEGIRVHGVNGSEGVLPDDQIVPVNELAGEMKLAMAMAIENNPGFFDMKRIDQGNFMTKQLYENGYNDEEVIMGLTMTGFRKQSFIDLDDDAGMREIIIDRLSADPDLARRIQDVTGGEKSLVIYGQLHLAQPTGDVDGTLPDNAVINVYLDQAEFAAKTEPKIAEAAQEYGLDFSDTPDFKLDIATGQWTVMETGEVIPIVLPNLPSVPETAVPEELPTLQRQAPAMTVPEIKF